MATTHPLSTVAFSVHEAITVNNRPMSVGDITEFLVRVWDDALEPHEAQEAAAALIVMGKLTVANGLYDTTLRNARGGRASPAGRDMNPESPTYGWF